MAFQELTALSRVQRCGGLVSRPGLHEHSGRIADQARAVVDGWIGVDGVDIDEVLECGDVRHAERGLQRCIAELERRRRVVVRGRGPSRPGKAQAGASNTAAQERRARYA
jgi:hypothetical protein